jgi:hypothetical protein
VDGAKGHFATPENAIAFAINEAKRAALRETIKASILGGGSNCADDVRRAVADRLLGKCRIFASFDGARDNLIEIAGYVAAAGGDGAAVGFIGEIIDKCEHLATLTGLLGRSRPELRPDIRCRWLQAIESHLPFVADAHSTASLSAR